MVAGLVKKKDRKGVKPKPVNTTNKPQPGFDGNYKGYKPSAASVQVEENFKAVMGPLKQPSFVTQPIEELQTLAAHKPDIKYMWDRISEGKAKSHGSPDFSSTEEALDFLLGVDVTRVFEGRVVGFDVTRNAMQENIHNKIRKVTKAFRGAREELFSKLGYDAYVVVVWKVRKNRLDRGDISCLQQQLVDGLHAQKEFAGSITLSL